MGAVTQYKLTFRVFHPTARAEDIARKFDLKSKHLRTVGAPRVSPTGQRLDGVYPRTAVSFDLTEYESEACLEDALSRALDEKLADKAPVISELIATGGHAEFFIGVFLDGNQGLMIDPDLMSRLAAAGITLALDLYP